MTGEGCGIKHPLQRNGKSQAQRVLKELVPSYVSVDERKVEDLLVFAAEMAKKVRYFDEQNKDDGTWEDFFINDISTQIALIAVTDLDTIKSNFEGLYNTVAASGTRADLVPLFDELMVNIRQIDRWARKIRSHTKFYSAVQNQIKSRLRKPVAKLIAMAKGATAIPPLNQLIDLDFSGLEPLWVEDYSAVPANTDVYGTGPSEAETVSQGARRIKSLFNIIFESQLRIVNDAEQYLNETLNEWPGHSPHMALFIAFILIFRHAQDHINTLTSRHLDFYYKEVLLLEPKEAVPDQVHLIFKIAKNVATHKLDEKTDFKAGKDDLKKEILYALDEELVINPGVAELFKTVFVSQNIDASVHAAPTANSGDGIGGDFEDPEVPTWKTFGSAASPDAEFGFALSAPILRLAEGDREIILNLYFEQESYNAALLARQHQIHGCDTFSAAVYNLIDTFKVSLTGEKGWLDVPAENVEIKEFEGTNRFRIIIAIDQEFEPVMDYNPKVHTDGFDAKYPTVKLIAQERSNLHPYYYLRHLKLEQAEFKVEVIGVQNLVVQNQTTVLKADSAFQPYGATPTLGYNFYIGSREVFAKNINALTVNLEWDDLPSPSFSSLYDIYPSPPSPTNVLAEWSFLDGREWKPLQFEQSGNYYPVIAPLFLSRQYLAGGGFNTGTYATSGIVSTDLKKVYIQDDVAGAPVGREVDLEPFKDFNHASQRGFIRLKLTGHSLDHHKYTPLLTRQTIALSKYEPAPVGYTGPPAWPAEPKIPNEPYTPTVKSISVNYKASSKLDLRYETDTLTPSRPAFEDRIERFFHIHPFGQQEVHPDYFEAASAPAEKDGTDLFLVPQWEGEGTLYIGVSGMDLKKSSSVSLLFQVSEGSANPDVKKPKITWSWLGNNEWTQFETYQITGDTTNGLVTSGIMNFSFPREATNDNSILPTGYHWIRGVVPERSSGIADVIQILAQAGRATFADNGNSPAHLENPLEAETIAKMRVKEPEVKSVMQPYASFGGKVAEKSQDYYVRASERLRHKDRAITIWDYETLLLEAFPDLYKVKCISHTNKYTQLAPGHVYVVVVTKQINKNAVNKLQPRASVNTLEQVAAFIKKRSTPFMKLEVQNPTYEAVQLDFKVRFKDGKDVGYYLIQLNEDLKKYLTPWAYTDGLDISFEGKVHSSVILDFVEELPYVEYLTHFKLRQFSPANPSGEELDEAIPTSPMSILVSHTQHLIEAIESEEA